MPKKPSMKALDLEPRYEVEVILGARVDSEANWEYRVKWLNYENKSNTWEPASGLAECPERTKAFWKHINLPEDAVCPIGFEVRAKLHWIKEQKILAAAEAQSCLAVSNDELSSSSDSSHSTSSDSDSEMNQPTSGLKIRIPPLKKQPIIQNQSEYQLPHTGAIQRQTKFAAPSTAVAGPSGSSNNNQPMQDVESPIFTENAPSSPTSLFSRSPSPATKLTSGVYQNQEPKVKMIPIETSGSASGSALSTKHRLTQMVAPNLSIYVRNTTPEVASGSIPQHASDTMLSVVNYTAYKEPQSSNRPDESLFMSPERMVQVVSPPSDTNPDDLNFATMFLNVPNDDLTMLDLPDTGSTYPIDDPVVLHKTIPSEPELETQEISLLGGIVTFTVESLIEDPIQVAELMHRIHKHPHWESYVFPPVLGMAANMMANGNDPVSLFQKGAFMFQEILELIEEGETCLLCAPPGEATKQSAWLESLFKQSVLKSPGLLEYCLTAYSELSSLNTPDLIGLETSKDLVRMRIQPALAKTYGCYVLITALDALDSGEPVETATIEEFIAAELPLDSDSD